MNKGFFITGIGTGAGKTIVSAAICEALEADYWKPVQCGNPDNPDSKIVRSLITNNKTQIHPERYFLKEAKSPHAAAQDEKITIKLNDFVLPVSERPVIVEGAGGLLVPLNNDGEYIADLVVKFQLPVILVVNFYLGSINHSLLSIEFMRSRKITPDALIFVPPVNAQSINIIVNQHNIPNYFMPEIKVMTPQSINFHSNSIKSFLLPFC